MSFFDDAGQTERKSWTDTFIRLSPDRPVTIQILEPEVKIQIWKHYIPQARRKSGGRGISIVCPGMDVCPICQNNSALGDKDHPEYIRTTRRYVVNVLDLTQQVVCPLCDNPATSKECEYCGTDLSDIAPTEPAIKLLEGGRRLFTQLDTMESTNTFVYSPDSKLLDPEIFSYSNVNPGDEIPLGITHYLIKIVMSNAKNPRDRVPTIIPVGGANDLNWREYQDKLVDPSEAYLTLAAEEVSELVAGGSLSEILKRRHAPKEESLDADEIPF